MTDRDLTELLTRSADRVLPAAPPLEEMISGAARRRRRRRRVTTLAAVVAALAAGTAVATTREPDVTGMVLNRPGPTRSAHGVPAGTRLVGVGHSAIAVPDGWATNALQCGTPTAPTVVVDVTVIESCGLLHPPRVDSVWIDQRTARPALSGARSVDIDGMDAQQSTTSCTGAADGRRCTATVYIPADHASYRATAATTHRVDEILSWIRAVPGSVAVPGYSVANDRFQDDDAGAHYRAWLEDLGLDVRVTTRARPGEKPGFVLGVWPRPGTMLEPGTTVTMTEIAEPHGPADEVSVAVNSLSPDESDYVGRSDRQVRSGTRIRLTVGSTLWFIGSGPRGGDLEGEVAGSALAPDTWKGGPNYGRSWRAVAPGTSTLTIRLTTPDGPIRIGTVTVVVD